MPASAPLMSVILQESLRNLGRELRAHRKKLKVSAVVAAEAAGMSRVTLHRIERGEPSVAMGAYFSAMFALGLRFQLSDPTQSVPTLASKIRLADYPQLKALAWQLKDTVELSPKEAFDLYERNWRHVDLKTMSSKEREFLETLLVTYGRGRILV